MSYTMLGELYQCWATFECRGVVSFASEGRITLLGEPSSLLAKFTGCVDQNFVVGATYFTPN
jgi:hypothetical protein